MLLLEEVLDSDLTSEFTITKETITENTKEPEDAKLVISEVEQKEKEKLQEPQEKEKETEPL